MGARLASPTSGRGYRIEHNSEINVTPFVDVMLVLLIIFMVAAPLSTVAIRLDLPRLGAGTPPPMTTNIAITANGRIYIANAIYARLSSLDDVVAGVAAAGGGSRDVPILIRADSGVRYGVFLSVIDRLQAAGYYHVALVGRPEGEQGVRG
jgi:biopolymer transport protein ExbD